MLLFYSMHRAYGVMIWEILTFGKQPLPDMNSQDIVNAAQIRGCLHHARYTHAYTSYIYIIESVPYKLTKINLCKCNSLIFACRPPNCPGELWDLVTECHQWEVEERPSFDEIVAMELFNVISQRPPLLNSTSISSETEQTMLLAKSESFSLD